MDIGLQLRPCRIGFGHLMQGFVQGQCLRGRHGGAVNQVAGKLQQIFGSAVAAQHRRTGHAHCLTKSNHQNIGLYARGGGTAPPFGAAYADAVGVVHQQPSAVFIA